MFPTRFVRHVRVGSLISDRSHFPLSLCRSSVAVSNFPSRTLSDYHTNFSDLCLLIEIPLIKKSVKSFSTKTGVKCWNCNEDVETSKFTCGNCGVLQGPNPEMTYFQLMNLPDNFDLDLDDMSAKFKTLQKMFHPDKFVHKSKEEIDISDHYSRMVNKAYSTLRNPLTRGMYILKMRGLETEDDSVKMSQGFLMDILEKNEQVENLNDGKTLLEFQKENTKIISDYVAKASKAFHSNDYQEAREILMKMKYFVNIDNELKKKKTALGIVD